MCAKSLQSYLNLCDPMDLAHQATLSMGFSRQEYWFAMPFTIQHWQTGSLPLAPSKKINPLEDLKGNDTISLETLCYRHFLASF